MFKGSCLCGGVRFEVRQVAGPVEICHCNRCRKKSGSASLPMVGIFTEDYTLLQGAELMQSFAAPILYSKPAYQSHFCSRCGSPVPPKKISGEWFEIPAGLFDTDPGIRLDKHIFVEFMPPWDQIQGGLPQYTLQELIKQRHHQDLPEDFELKSHYDVTSGS